MSIIIIEGGGGHNNITRIVVASVTGQLTDAQTTQFRDCLQTLQELADEVDPQ